MNYYSIDVLLAMQIIIPRFFVMPFVDNEKFDLVMFGRFLLVPKGMFPPCTSVGYSVSQLIEKIGYAPGLPGIKDQY
jgi:hypothetical protein